MTDAIHAKNECKRCGTCCRKGGPSFHLEDKAVIEKGYILIKHLYTIREGELAYDNVKGCLLPVTSDIIKIKGKKGSWACVFLEERKNICRIYDYRPVECRALQCWDTRDIEKIYSKDRLTRKDLIFGVKGLWELVEDHRQRCSYIKLGDLVRSVQAGKKNDALQRILEMIRYDNQLRSLIAEKGDIDPDILDFLFGRKLIETIGMFGLKIRKKGNHTVLVPDRPPTSDLSMHVGRKGND